MHTLERTNSPWLALQRNKWPWGSCRDGQQSDHLASLIRLAKSLMIYQEGSGSFPEVIRTRRVKDEFQECLLPGIAPKISFPPTSPDKDSCLYWLSPGAWAFMKRENRAPSHRLHWRKRGRDFLFLGEKKKVVLAHLGKVEKSKLQNRKKMRVIQPGEIMIPPRNTRLSVFLVSRFQWSCHPQTKCTYLRPAENIQAGSLMKSEQLQNHKLNSSKHIQSVPPKLPALCLHNYPTNL